MCLCYLIILSFSSAYVPACPASGRGLRSTVESERKGLFWTLLYVASFTPVASILCTGKSGKEKEKEKKRYLLFSTPKGAYVNENHALFVRQREPYIHGRSSNWNNDFLLSSCLFTVTDKISRNTVGHYCRKAVAWVGSHLSLKEIKCLVFVRKSHSLQAAVAVVHLNRKVTCFLRTPKQKPACCTKTHAEQHHPVLCPGRTPILNERCQIWNLSYQLLMYL